MVLHDHERFSVVGVHNYGKSIVIKEKLKNERMKYVRSLKNKNIIDDEAADLIIYG